MSPPPGAAFRRRPQIPRRTGARALLFAAASCLGAAAAPARGAPDPERTAQAEALFQEAVRLIDAGKAAEACPKLEESERLDAGIGTEFRLADCYERIGRTASAWADFLDLAGKVQNPDQIQKARARADALEPKLSRLTIVVPAEVSLLEGIEIQRDGAPVGKPAWGSAAPVDPGKHRVRAAASGREAWEATLEVTAPGATVEVRVPPLQPASMSAQRIAALVAGGLGLAGIGVGAVLGALAGSTWSDAKTMCPAKVACSRGAHDLSVKALSLSYGSTGAFVGGGAALAGAVILWLTATSGAPQKPSGVLAAPLIGAGTMGAQIEGVF